ncbi:MAG TPA: SufD family Fe-S cluster assembly protein [Acholeplasma sp.]|jgi:Fe-S cluster assembly protein SufD
MTHVLIKNEEVSVFDLPKAVSVNHSELTVLKNQVVPETIKIAIQEKDSKPFKITVGENAQAKIIFEISETEDVEREYFVELDTKASSHVKFLLVSNIQSSHATLHFSSNHHQDSTTEFIGGFISHVLNAKLDMKLVGRGANLKVRTIAVSATTNDQTLDVHMVHHAKDTVAEMTNIGIAADSGKIKLNGVGKIEQGMKNSNAYQTLKGIIISDNAEINVNPILIIDEYDVKAGHAATVGRLEEEVLYYLRSRGLTLEEATKLVINGFLQPVIDEIDDEPLKESVIALINERI